MGFTLTQAAIGMQEAYNSKPTVKIGCDEIYLMDGIVYVIGSNDLLDWWYNVEIIPRRHLGSWYHSGFLLSFKVLAPIILEMKPFLVVGHSRGAAIAAMFSRICRVPSINFNCPRPLWLSKRRLETPCVNIQAIDDAICSLPPLFTGYRHIGTTIEFPGLPTSLHEDHRMKWTIDRLKLSVFGSMTPFVVQSHAEITNTHVLEGDKPIHDQ